MAVLHGLENENGQYLKDHTLIRRTKALSEWIGVVKEGLGKDVENCDYRLQYGLV